MSIGRISGPMLKPNLERQGIDLSVETDLLYIDVNNSRIGINNALPGAAFDLTGVAIFNQNLQIDGTTISSINLNGNINLTPNGTGEVVASTLAVSDLTSGRVAYVGTGGALLDSANLTFDGTSLTINGNLVVNGTATTVDTTNLLIADPLIVLSRGETGTPSKDVGIIVNRGTSTNVAIIWDESADVFALINTTEAGTTSGDVAITSYANLVLSGLTATSTSTGNISVSGNTISSSNTNGNITLQPNGTGDVVLAADTVTVGDANANATITTSGTGDLILNTNSGTNSGNITIADGANGNISLTPNGTGEVILSTLAVTDLTSGRVPYVTTNDAITDSANLTFNGTLLTTTNLTVDNVNIDSNTISTTSGNLSITGTGGEVTVNSLAVTDLTSGRVTYAGTSGALQDSANLTFNGTLLTTTNLTVDNINVDGNTIISTNINGNINITPNGSGEVIVSTLAVTDLTSGRVPYVTTNDAITDSANFTFNGTTLGVTGNLTVDNITIDGDTISSAHTTITIDPASAGTGGTVVIAGNLEVTGTTTTVNSTIVTIADPVFQLGSDSVDDNLDRGIKALYNDGAAKIAFFGRDDSNGEFIYINDATDTSSVFSGTLGSAAFGSLRVTDLTSTRVLYAGASGEVTDSANLTFNGTDLTMASAVVSDLTSGRVIYAGTSGALQDSANLTFNGTTLTTTDLTVDNIDIDGNSITSVNLNGNINITPNGSGEVIVSTLAVTDLTSGRVPYVTTNDAITDSANLTFNGTLLTTTNLTVDNINVDGSSIISTNTNGNINITPNGTGEVIVSTLAITDLTSGRVPYVTTNDAITDSANFTFNGTLLTVTNLTVDNINVDGNSITSSNALTLNAAAAQSIVLNEAGADVDIRFESDTEVNALFIEGSTGNIGVRTGTPNTGAALHVNTTNSIILPVGTTAERPSGVSGMVRFNTTLLNLEFFNGTEWLSTDKDFTIFVADSFTGDGVTTNFALSKSATSAGVIVAIDGLVQDPGVDYSVSGSTLIFTIAPALSANIDVRIITTSASVIEIADLDTKIAVDDLAETATTTINGNVVLQVTNAAVVPGANVTYDLGSTSLRWNTIYGQATSAQYADLAENYVADQAIEPATVVSFGGNHEVTVSTVDADRRVAGVVSTNPAHLMNSECAGDHVVAVALQGRVPCRVVGTVRKGDMMVSAGNGAARAEENPSVGSVVGKALENFDGDSGIIEVVVGR